MIISFYCFEGVNCSSCCDEAVLLFLVLTIMTITDASHTLAMPLLRKRNSQNSKLLWGIVSVSFLRTRPRFPNIENIPLARYLDWCYTRNLFYITNEECNKVTSIHYCTAAIERKRGSFIGSLRFIFVHYHRKHPF